MKKHVLNALRASALAATALVLIATSRASECPVGPAATYRVAASTCGPTGTVELSNDANCNVTMAGAEALNLPGAGSSDDNATFLSGFTVTNHGATYRGDADAGHFLVRADGGVDQFSNCTAKPSAGAASSGPGFVLDCGALPDAGALCHATLVEGAAPTTDGGT